MNCQILSSLWCGREPVSLTHLPPIPHKSVVRGWYGVETHGVWECWWKCHCWWERNSAVAAFWGFIDAEGTFTAAFTFHCSHGGVARACLFPLLIHSHKLGRCSCCWQAHMAVKAQKPSLRRISWSLHVRCLQAGYLKVKGTDRPTCPTISCDVHHSK